MSKCSLVRIYVNAQGYDSSGHYYGTGKSLYQAYDEGLGIDAVFRAANRDEAKSELRQRFPTIKFYN